MPLKIGDQIKQKVVVLEGTVIDAVYDAATGKFKYLMQYPEGDGTSARWFVEDEIEQVGEQA